MTAQEIISLVGAVVAVFASIAAIITFVLSRKKEGYAEGDKDGELKGDIKSICRGIDDLRLEVKDINRKQDDMIERLIRCEESTKQAHKRIDEIRGEKRGKKGDDDN